MILSRCNIRHDVLGDVCVSERSDARRFIARWRDGVVHLTVPSGVVDREILDVLDRLAPRLMSKRPAVSYYDDMVIALDGFVFEIKSQSHRPASILATVKEDRAYLEVGTDIDMSSDKGRCMVSSMMCRVAAKIAPRMLLPAAAELARRLGVEPASWHIMSGYRTLGKCTSARSIHLSHALVFLPRELRDYIICHELAHLTYMCHSRRFHELCDRYCGGREAACIAALKSYRWPILR